MPVLNSLRKSYLEAFFSSLMIGAGESFFAAFALSKGMGEVFAGLVVGLPMMMGAIMQLGTPFLWHRVGSAKRWAVLTALFQSVMLAFMVLSANLVDVGRWAIFVMIGFYWAAAFSHNAVWNLWLAQVVEPSHRNEFLSRRLRLTQYGIMAGIFVGGSLLHSPQFALTGPAAFSTLFAVALISRVISALCLSTITAGPHYGAETNGLSMSGLQDLTQFWSQTWRSFYDNPRVRGDLTFLFFMNVAVFISSSFVAPFMLAKLKFDYLSFMAAQMGLFLGKGFSLLLAQRVIQRFGVRRVLFLGALGMAPLPALWYFIEHTALSVVLQSLSGFFWGFFEVGVGLVLFSELPHHNKVQLLTWNSFFQTLAVLIGTLVGGQILGVSGESYQGYYSIFFLAAFLRTVLVLGHRRHLLGVTGV